uniref:DPF1-3 N-terminal domain-containing protein n=2 Tax=Stomoxys calcitrans TaxID=35570 RepID=A0A1I8PQU3_STOCA
MSAPEIEVANVNNFEKIQNFLNDSAYKEILENSENYNTRLCIERRLRMPFLDPQTGVAQTHCALFVKQKQRMPGFREGQLYTYPSSRWRKPKRQYLHNHHHSYRPFQYRESHHHNHHHYATTAGSGSSSRDHHQNENAALTADGNSMSASGDNDSKDSHANAEKEWFHEDMEMTYHHHEDFEDDFESDNDFDESYSARGKRKRGTATGSTRWRKSNTSVDGTPKRGRKGGGTRRRGGANADGEGSGEPTRRRRGGAGGAAASNTSAAAAAAPSVTNVAPTTISHSNSASPITNTDDSSQPGLTLPSSVNTNAPVTAPIVPPPPIDNSSSNATDAS